MKILQVTHRYPPQTGGVETHVREISERLVKRGHEVTVLSADAQEGGSRRERRNGVKIRRFPGLAPGNAFYLAPGVAPAVRRCEADVVHTHNYHSLPAFFAALGYSDAQLVHTAHYHGASTSSLRDILLRLYRPVGAWTLNRASDVIAVSGWERDRLREDFGAAAAVIPNGVRLEQFDNPKPEPHRRPYLLYVGRLEAYKGVQDVIRTLPRLPEYNLLVAGSGDFRGELERIAANTGVSDRVRFLGYVDDDRLPGLYAGADVCLQLSEFEAYGMTVAEALASRTPCVVRMGSALNDWVVNPGVVGVRSSSPEQVEEAVIKVRERTPTQESVLDWDDVVHQIERTYKSPSEVHRGDE